jgi:transcriptional regulator with XRE-family HTH domain
MPTDTIAAENLEVDSTELSNIGERIRSFRLARNWTLDQLATRSALSKSYISRLEDGDRHPSIASLLSITRAMNISLGQLLTDGKSSPFVSIVRGDQIPATPGNGLSYQVHSNGFPGAVMQPIRITISASRTGSELYRHEGEEWLFVLSGKLAVTLGRFHSFRCHHRTPPRRRRRKRCRRYPGGKCSAEVALKQLSLIKFVKEL